MSEGKSFWTSMPGVMTGIAALLSAGIAVIPFVRSGGDRPAASSTPTATPTPSGTATASPSTSATAEPAVEDEREGRIVASSGSLDFGKQIIGSTGKTLDVTVSNVGEAPAVIERASIIGVDDEAFSLVANTCGTGLRVGPEGECVAKVEFAPKAGGTFSAALVIEHTGVNSPTTIDLSGTSGLL